MQHVFISYVSENEEMVDKLCKALESHDIKVWLDRNDIKPGARWRQAIREAIREGAFFIACFSKEYNNRSKTDKTYMNEELTIAVEELRQRDTNQSWFIPIQLNKCKIPDRNIGGGETLNDIQHVKLYKDWDAGIQSIVKVIQLESPESTRDGNTTEAGINQDENTEFSENFINQDGTRALRSHKMGPRDEFKFEPSSEEYRSMIIDKIEDTLQDVENSLKNRISDKEAFKLIGKHDALERLTAQINSIREDSVNLVDPTSAIIGIPQYLNTSNKFLNAAYFAAKNIRDNPRGFDGSVASSPEGEIGKKEAMSQIMDYINYIK